MFLPFRWYNDVILGAGYQGQNDTPHRYLMSVMFRVPCITYGQVNSIGLPPYQKSQGTLTDEEGPIQLTSLY